MRVTYLKINHYAYVCSILIKLVIFVCYVWSVQNGHVFFIMPFVSESGSIPPESCLFSTALTLTAVFKWVIFCLNHGYVQNYICTKYQDDRQLIAANNLSYWLATTVSVNLFLLGNFQQSNWFVTHFYFAGSVFQSALLYMYMEVYVTYMLNLSSPWTYLLQFRLVLTIVNTFLILICGSFTVVTVFIAHRNGMQILELTPQDNGYIPHTIAATSEWAFIFIYTVFFAINFTDKSPVAIQMPKIKFNDTKDGKTNVQLKTTVTM